MNDSPQGTSRLYARVPLTLTVRTLFTSECDDPPSQLSELSRLLLYRLTVLEAALQRVARIRDDAADAPALETVDGKALLDRISETPSSARHGVVR